MSKRLGKIKLVRAIVVMLAATAGVVSSAPVVISAMAVTDSSDSISVLAGGGRRFGWGY